MSGAAASTGRLASLRASSSGTPALVSSVARAASAFAPSSGSTSCERGRDRLDAGAIVLDHLGEALRHVDIAHEPDDAVEQQVLDRRVEIELQLAGDLVVERVDRAC